MEAYNVMSGSECSSFWLNKIEVLEIFSVFVEERGFNPKLGIPLYTTKPRGISLGLATSIQLVEATGGRIEVESMQGQGSTFTVVLPVKSMA